MIQTIAVYGKLKTGKSAFALSAPLPIVFFDFELGLDTIEPRFKPDMSQVTVYSMIEQTLLDKRKDMEESKRFWADILIKYNKALEDPNIKSVVFDTFSSVWGACRNCYLAELKQGHPERQSLMPQEYAEPNRRMKMMLTQSRLHNKILVLTHHTREIYDDAGKATGALTFDGFKYSGDLADVVLLFEKKDKKPYITIESCRLSMMAEGLHPNSTFDGVEAFIESIRMAGGK